MLWRLIEKETSKMILCLSFSHEGHISVIITRSLCYNLIRVHCSVIKNINEEQQDPEHVHPPMLDALLDHDIQAHVSVVGTSQSSVRIQGYFRIQRAAPVVLSGKESACGTGATGDVGSTPGPGRSPGRGHGIPLQHSCLENPHGLRSLMGYNPWSCKESDATELT